MLPLNLAAIEKEANQLRNAEIQRIQTLFLAKVSAYSHQVAGTMRSGLTAINNSLRHLFSWNPQAH